MAKGRSYCVIKEKLIREENLKMQPTTEILARISRNSLANKDEIFTRLYRYMLRSDLYFLVYKNLYANSGAATKGANDDTADGFSETKIANIIQRLAGETYQPTPVRRTYIKKKNNPKKKRPLGIPTFTDKLVQEVLRMFSKRCMSLFSCQFPWIQTQKELPYCTEILKNGVQWYALVRGG